jgi:hypothetical protein
MLSFLKKFMVSLVFTLTAAPLLASAAPTTTTTLTVSPSNSVSVGTIVTHTKVRWRLVCIDSPGSKFPITPASELQAGVASTG